MARLQRRQTDRRRRRQLGLWKLLQENGFLPEGERASSLASLDRQLQAQYQCPYKLPYLLRAKALDEELPLHALGRAIYHLAQRRGFLSNRKSAPKDDEAMGMVKTEISILESAMQATGSRTLGEYFALHCDPHQDRIRTRYTSRQMYLREFDLLWAAQAVHRPEILTNELRQKIHRQMFFQRPLKPQTDTIGVCELEPSERRAPMASPIVQRFRLLSAANNLRLQTNKGEPVELPPADRQKIISLLAEAESVKYTQLRKQLGLKPGIVFSIESGGEASIKGDIINARFSKALGATWRELSLEGKSELLNLLINGPDDDEEVQALIVSNVGLDEASARASVRVPLPQGYYSISLRAMMKLLPDLESGLPYATAQLRQYPPVLSEPVSSLPPVAEVLPAVRNPIVMRALTELRKTVNSIVAKFGKPEFIHVELARDLKRSPTERMKMLQRNRDNEKRRTHAKQQLAAHLGAPPDSFHRRDVEKYLLWMECAHTCPYSGQAISLESLFGSHPQFDIEHIIPFSRSLDDSFDNKTLCWRQYNARKGNQTPFEAFGADEQEWEGMVSRVAGWNQSRKLARFTISTVDQTQLLEEFTERHLNDTRYASRLAAKYLGTLFGGIVDAEGKKRIRTCTGQVTAYLRSEWRMNDILNPTDSRKTRNDHRHHAIDAAVVALSTPSIVKRLSDCAAQAISVGRRRFGILPPPWPDFFSQMSEAIAETNVSTRPEYKLNARMHKDTGYSAPKAHGPNGHLVHTRKGWANEFDLESIVDPRVRQLAIEKLAALDGKFALLAHHPPEITHPNGETYKIRKVRVAEREKPVPIGSPAFQRFFLTDGIHHTEIVRDETGKKVKFLHYPVTVVEALRRHRMGVPIVHKEFGERQQLICTLRSGDVLELPQEQGAKRTLWRVMSVRQSGQMALKPLVDAREKKDIVAAKALLSPTVNTAFAQGARKVRISLLGEVLPAND